MPTNPVDPIHLVHPTEATAKVTTKTTAKATEAPSVVACVGFVYNRSGSESTSKARYGQSKAQILSNSSFEITTESCAALLHNYMTTLYFLYTSSVNTRLAVSNRTIAHLREDFAKAYQRLIFSILVKNDIAYTKKVHKKAMTIASTRLSDGTYIGNHGLFNDLAAGLYELTAHVEENIFSVYGDDCTEDDDNNIVPPYTVRVVKPDDTDAFADDNADDNDDNATADADDDDDDDDDTEDGDIYDGGLRGESHINLLRQVITLAIRNIAKNYAKDPDFWEKGIKKLADELSRLGYLF